MSERNAEDSDSARKFLEAFDRWSESMPFGHYSPFRTYSNDSTHCFLDADGEPVHRDSDSPDAEAIWRIGRDAYRLLGIKSQDDFRQRHDEFREMVVAWRKIIAELIEDGRGIDQHGDPLTPGSVDLSQREASEILSIAWQFIEDAKKIGFEIGYPLKGEQLAFACLHEVDNVLLGMDFDGQDAVASTVAAVNALADAQAFFNGSDGFREVRRKMAYDAAIARHRKDPKQAEKKFVFECYQAWRGSPERYKSKAAFARDMLDKVEHLESQKKIEDGVRKWEARPPTGTLPAE